MKTKKYVDIERYLYKVTKPSQYIGNEINSFIKDDYDILFTMIYPDTYEIGMSHLGWQILYYIVNYEFDNISFQRAFMPAMDLLEVMRENRIPQFTLEEKLDIACSDAIMFTLQYELNYTNILEMLDLSNIPIFSKDRREDDAIIFAGGTSISNPMVLSEFIDVFVFGDGESTIREISQIFNNYSDRNRRLEELSKLPYTFVPLIDDVTKKRVVANIEPKLEDKNYPLKRVVPNIGIVHDRITVEIMRGCVRGCRFCSAGMLYRPFREKNLKSILTEIANGISSTGDDEVGILSLSSSDYSQIDRFLQYAYRLKKEKNVIVSLPSTRIDNMPKDIGDELFKKNSITIAPEAGSQRLRDILNKNISRDEIFNSVRYSFDNNWNVIKLYFMIGLPFETWDDIEEMVKLINEIAEVAKEYKKGRRKEIHISIGPFTPRPFTPFQWHEFMDVEEILKRAKYIKEKTYQKFVKVSYRDPYVSMIETALIRGDKSASLLVYNMWKKGAILQGWNEYFDKKLWIDGINELNLFNTKAFSGFELTDTLPWDFVSYGVSKEYYLNELKKAKDEIKTPDCKFSNCSICGVCGSSLKNVEAKKDDFSDEDFNNLFDISIIDNSNNKNEIIYFNRLIISKINSAKFLSFNDFRDKIKRALIATKINPKYSKGFAHLIDFSFSNPTPFGVSSKYEEVEFKTDYLLTQKHIDSLNNFLPKTIQIISFISQDSKILPELFKYETVLYSVDFFNNKNKREFIENISKIVYQKKSKKGKVKIVNFIDGVLSYYIDNNKIVLRIYNVGKKSVKLDLAISTFFNKDWFEVCDIEKIGH